jgi:hypothetical protein
MLRWARYERHAPDGDQSRFEGRPCLVGSGRYCEPDFEPAPQPARYEHVDQRKVTKIGTPVLQNKETK